MGGKRVTNSINKNSKGQAKKATAITLALLVAGTFAWQAFDQSALNESSHRTDLTFNTGGRLHDDYNGVNKDVYVENYADAETGEDIFARIRLDEYFEYGEGAGTTEVGEDVVMLRGDIQNVDTPLFRDLDTWDTYLFDSESEEGTESIRTYRGFEFGGSTVYMPTFNKDNNNLDSDINGSYAGPDGDRTTDYDRYLDYEEYTVDEESEASTVYYANPDDEALSLTVEGQVHIAKETLDAEVVSMADWIDDGSPIGEYWVYDVDGWAYWAAPIEPQTSTGLLITEILMNDEYDGEWYYGVNVVNQSASEEGWSNFFEIMEEDDITEDGLELLEAIMGAEYEPGEPSEPEEPSEPTNPNATIDVYEVNGAASVKRGSTLNFSADITGLDDTDVSWDVYGGSTGTSISGSGVLTVDATENQHIILEVVAESKEDTTLTGSILVVVEGSGGSGLIVTADTKTTNRGGNVVLTTTVDGEVTTDVSYNIVSGNTSADTKITGNNLSIGDDEVNGTAITIESISNVDGDITGTTFVVVNTASLTITSSSLSADLGDSVTLLSAISGLSSTEVDYEVSGNASADTKIEGNILTIGDDETDGAEILITGKARANTSVSGTVTVKVNAVSINISGPASISRGDSQIYTVITNGLTSSAVIWDVADEAGELVTGVSIADGVLSVSTDVANATELVVKATSAVNGSVIGTYNVVVSNASVLVTSDSGTINKGGSMVISAEVIGLSGDDVTYSISGTELHADTKITDDANGYQGTLEIAPEEAAGKVITVTATAKVDGTTKISGTKTITVATPTLSSLTENGTTQVYQGGTLDFSSTYTNLDGIAYYTSWTIVSGEEGSTSLTNTSTPIGEKTTLSVDAAQTMYSMITLRCELVADSDVYVEKSVIVTNEYAAKAGTTETVTIEGTEFYVLTVGDVYTYESSDGGVSTSQRSALLWAVEPWKSEAYVFNTSRSDGYDKSTWYDSDLQASLESEMAATTTLKDMALYVDTTISSYTRTQETINTYDRFFPLSEVEFSRYVGIGDERAKDSAGAIGGASSRWLRSPYSSEQIYAIWSGNASYDIIIPGYSRGVRPALWVAVNDGSTGVVVSELKEAEELEEPVEVLGLTKAELDASYVGTSKTVTIDGVEFYVLTTTTNLSSYASTAGGTETIVEEAALLYAKESWLNTGYVFNTSRLDEYDLSAWYGSELKDTMETLITDTTDIKANALYVDTTVTSYSGDTVNTYDRFFPLSYDEFTTYIGSGDNRAKDSSGSLITGSPLRWLRSPANVSTVYVVRCADGLTSTNSCTGIRMVRPALWIAL